MWAVGPSPLPRCDRSNLSALHHVSAQAKAGCVDETTAAVEAAFKLSHATHDATRRALTEIARDEARHAVRAGQTVLHTPLRSKRPAALSSGAATLSFGWVHGSKSRRLFVRVSASIENASNSKHSAALCPRTTKSSALDGCMEPRSRADRIHPLESERRTRRNDGWACSSL